MSHVYKKNEEYQIIDKGMIKVPANFQVNQIIGSLAINRPVMYVKRSKIVTMRPPLWIFFEI